MTRHTFASMMTVTLLATLAGACTSNATKKQRYVNQGNHYSSKGEYRQAIIAYRQAVQLDEKFGEARARLALAYEQVGDPVQALRELVRAADLLPDDAKAQLHAGELLLRSGQFEDAASRARQVLERDPRNLDALVLLGSASAGVKDSDKVLATLEQASKELPSEPRLQQSLGAIETSRGNREAAESAFRRAVEIAPKSVEAHEALASYYWSTNQAAKAEQVLKEALPIDSSGSTLIRNLAAIYFIEGRDQEAEPHLVKLVNQSPKNVTLRLTLGDLYGRARRFDDALRVYEPLTKDESAFPSATARMANADHLAGRKDKAYKRLNDGLNRLPKDSDLQTMFARLSAADGKFHEAEVAAKIALQTTPERVETLYVLGSAMVELGRDADALPILQQAAKSAPRALGPKLQLAGLYYRRGDVKTALPFAQDAVALNPNQPLARLTLGRILTAQRDVARAEQVLKPLIQAFPGSPQAQVAVGNLAVLKKDWPASRAAYARALQLNPGSNEAIKGLVAVDLAQGKKDDAVSLVRRALAAQPSDVRILTMAARTYLAAKDDRQAETTLQQAIKQSPSSMEAYEMLAGLYFRQNRLSDAKAQFETIARQQPAAVGPPTMVGIILQLQGKTKEAQAVYERLLQTNAQAPLAANNLAMLLVESGGNLDVALNYAQAAKNALPNDPDVSDTLGLVYLKKGLASLAASAFEVSTKTRPTSAEFWLHIGQAYAGSGKKAEARDALQRALKLDSQSSGAATARKLLEDLNKRA